MQLFLTLVSCWFRVPEKTETKSTNSPLPDSLSGLWFNRWRPVYSMPRLSFHSTIPVAFPVGYGRKRPFDDGIFMGSIMLFGGTECRKCQRKAGKRRKGRNGIWPTNKGLAGENLYSFCENWNKTRRRYSCNIKPTFNWVFNFNFFSLSLSEYYFGIHRVTFLKKNLET